MKGFKAHPDFRPDYIYCGRNLPPVEEREGDYIVDADVWTGESGTYPAFPYNMLPFMSQCTADLKFLFLSYGALNEEVRACLKYHPEVVVISQSNHQNRLGEHRALVHELTREGLQNPVVIFQQYAHGQEEKEDFQIESAADMGALLFDGLCDGLYLYNNGYVGASRYRRHRIRASFRLPVCGRPRRNISLVPVAGARSTTCKTR